MKRFIPLLLALLLLTGCGEKAVPSSESKPIPNGLTVLRSEESQQTFDFIFYYTNSKSGK